MYSCSVGLSVTEGLFNLLFYCESAINQYDGQVTLADVFGASLLLLEPSFFRNIAPFKNTFSCFYEKTTSC